MNGMQRGIEGSVFIFPMILRIRTARPERLNWLNSVMPRQISVQLSSTIRLDMILRIKNHSFTKPILEVLTTYAVKRNQAYFLKEFLNPVYPSGNCVSLELREQKIKECEEYQNEKTRLYQMINNVSDGNLVRISEFFRYDSHYYIATERVVSPKMSFQKMQEIPFMDRMLLCKTIAHAVKQLHSAHIVHADIKEANILLKKTATYKYVGKIIDFDCSFFEDNPPQFEEELGGDQIYLAPEACQFICGENVKLTCKIDVFALGLLFHQYLTGKMPDFDHNEYDYAFDAVLDDQELGISTGLLPELQTMIKGMLEKEPEKRLSMDAVYKVFESLDPNSEKIKTTEAAEPAEAVESAEPVEPVKDKKKDGKWFFQAGDL